MPDRPPPVDYLSGGFTIAPATRRLSRNGVDVEIEAKVFDLIALLVRHHERALGKQAIIESLWGHRPITDAALSQLIYKARRAVGDDGERQAVIRTIYGRGLQWIAPVQETGSAPVPPVVMEPPPITPPESPGVAPVPARRHRPVWLAAAAIMVAAIGIGLAWWLVPRGLAADAPAPPRVALLPIENATGEASLDWTTHGLPGLVGSLLDQTPGLDVVDPLQVARAWEFTPTGNRTRAEHTRYVVGAEILVRGELTRITDHFYQLTLHVDAGKRSGASEVVVSGSDPGQIGLAAIPRLRGVLRLDAPAPSPFTDTPSDAYLAETFARGIDLATHGDWQAAKPYFVLVAKGEPSLLQVRYLLAKAQGNTDEQRESRAAYAGLLADARRMHRPAIAARVLSDQASDATNEHENTKALRLADEAIAAARQADDPGILAGALLAAGRINVREQHVELALHQYEEARKLIERAPIPRLQPLLHNTMAFIADARHDPPAAIAAARAELAADEALGNERSSQIARFNLAYALSRNNHPLEALPLLTRVWSWSAQNHSAALQLAAGNTLVGLLYDMGLYEEIRPLIDASIELAGTHGNRFVQSRLLDLRAGGEYFRGNRRDSLAISRNASALIDPAEDPAGAIERYMVEAFVTLPLEPAALADIRQRVDRLIAQLPDPSGVLQTRHLVHALAAAADRDAKGIVTGLTAAAAAQADRDLLHQTAMQIALAAANDDAVRGWLREFNVDAADATADSLRLYAEWCSRHGDAGNAERAHARLMALRQPALAALASAGFDPSHPL